MIFTCGKLEHVWDSRTLQFANFMSDAVTVPSRFDFDKGRVDIPFFSWGSDVFKCDVIASQANQLLRFGRIDQRRTIPLQNQNVIRRYRRLAGVQEIHDKNDIGLSALHAMRAWHREGWKIRKKNYKIMLYGEIDPREHDLFRRAIYLFKGVHIGFWLPKIMDGMRSWDYTGQNGELWKAGSLGGVLAYCKAYNERGYQVLLQGQEIFVTDAFVDHFSDEAWVCLEGLNEYWTQQALDIEKLTVLRPELSTLVERGV